MDKKPQKKRPYIIVTEDTHKKLKILAAEKGMTLTQVIEFLLKGN